MSERFGRPAGRAAGPAFIHADIAVSSPAEVSAMAISAGKREMDNLQRLLALAFRRRIAAL